MTGRLGYGGDYNPEQWPEQVWADDVRLMQAAGVNLATVGVFSWARIEPRPGEYDFGWLDRVLDLLHAGGIGVDLATATASPPPWLARLDPDSLPVRADGSRLWTGSRQAYCPSSQSYRDRALSLVDHIAARYGQHPALELWHVGNEFGCHVSECFCDRSATRFRAWLAARYGDDLDRLNQAWGTAFWSQHYAQWAEVWPPRITPTLPNPSQRLDWRRFCSDELLDHYRAERDVLRRHTPDMPVTTNFIGFFPPLDYWRWAPELDVIAQDSYPDPADDGAPVDAAMAGDLMRGLGRGRPWLLMEQASARVNWRRRNAPKRPGQLRLWSLQAVARGADAVLYFQWRQSVAGAEKWHSAMVGHDGEVRPDVAELGRELAGLSDVVGARVPARTALLFSWDNWWALSQPGQPAADLDYPAEVRRLYAPLWAANVPVDVLPPGADLAGYRLVLVPTLYLITDSDADRLRSFVDDGGTLLVGFWSGLVDERDHVRAGAYPGALRDLLGIRVAEYAPLGENATAGVRFAEGRVCQVRQWTERLVPDPDTEVLASYADGDLAGLPAVTRNRYGRGVAYYVSAPLPPAGVAAVLDRARADAGVAPTVAGLPAGVEAVRRGPALFLLNHGDDEVTCRVLDGEVRLGARDAVVLRPDPADAGTGA
jgi:beta-galactosidase